MANQISRRAFLRGSLLVTGGLLAACAAPAAAPAAPAAEAPAAAAEAPAAAAAPAQEDILLRWDTFRGVGTPWNEERISTFKEIYPNVTIEFRPLTDAVQQNNYATVSYTHLTLPTSDLV